MNSFLKGETQAMVYMLIAHKIKDWDKWKPGFDAHASFRASFGCKGGIVFRDQTDPNMIYILLKFEQLERAQQFQQSENLKKNMADLGVTGEPVIHYLNEVDRPAH